MGADLSSRGKWSGKFSVWSSGRSQARVRPGWAQMGGQHVRVQRFVHARTHLLRDVGLRVGERLGDGDGLGAVTLCSGFLATQRASKYGHVQSSAYGGTCCALRGTSWRLMRTHFSAADLVATCSGGAACGTETCVCAHFISDIAAYPVCTREETETPHTTPEHMRNRFGPVPIPNVRASPWGNTARLASVCWQRWVGSQRTAIVHSNWRPSKMNKEINNNITRLYKSAVELVGYVRRTLFADDALRDRPDLWRMMVSKSRCEENALRTKCKRTFFDGVE